MAAGDGSIGLNHRFQRGIGGVALEVFSVVLGVLVALAVDGWSAERALQARADGAKSAILAEVRANMAELDGALATLEGAARPLASAAPLDPGESSLHGGTAGEKALEMASPEAGSIELTLPEFSRAAWQTAQMTDATTRLDFDWLIKVAQAYETQSLYAELRVDVVRTMGDLRGADRKAALGQLRGQLEVLLDVHRSLTETYQEILAREGT